MIHLIDRVYLDYAEAKPMPQNPLMKPEAFVRIIDRNLSGIIDLDTENKNLFNTKNVEEAFAIFGEQNLFINHLMTQCNTDKQKKVVIYVDEIANIKLLSCLWKTIFPKLTAEGAFKIYQCYKDFEFLKPKDQVDFIALGEDSRQIEKSYFFDKYWSKSFEDFAELFNQMPAFSLTLEQKAKIGTEFQMINYILNPNSDHSALFSKVDHLYKKNMIKEITGLLGVTREYLYNILSTESNGANPFHLNEKSAIDYLKAHSKYSLLLDDQILYSIKGYEHLKTKYNLIKVCSDLVNAEAIALNHLGIAQEKKDIPCCVYIIENHAEPDLKTVLDHEIFYGSNFRLFRELAKKGRYNQYLVYAFAITKKQGTESLAEFSV